MQWQTKGNWSVFEQKAFILTDLKVKDRSIDWLDCFSLHVYVIITGQDLLIFKKILQIKIHGKTCGEVFCNNNNNNNSGHLLCAGIRPKTLMAQAIIITLSLSGNHQNHFAFNQAICSQWPIIGANLSAHRLWYFPKQVPNALGSTEQAR